MQGIRIHQFHPTAAFGDAVTNQMFFIRESLRRAGIGGEIFAETIKGLSRGEVRPYAREAVWDCDLLLLHHSLGFPGLPRFLRLELPKALVYHNVTPASFFRHDPILAELCELGRRQLELIRPHALQAFAESRYNQRELEELGFEGTGLLPLLDLSGRPPPPPRRAPEGERTLLFVGRITPHKNQALLVQTLHYLRRFGSVPYRLVLVGGGDPLYIEYCRGLARVLGVSGEVTFTGKVSRETLDCLYGEADAFVSVSLHEGFCVPLVEAMAAGLPVLALGRAAVPETLGGAGVELLTESPSALATAVDEVLGSEAALGAIRRSQWARFRELTETQRGDLVPERLGALVRHLRTAPAQRPPVYTECPRPSPAPHE